MSDERYTLIRNFSDESAMSGEKSINSRFTLNRDGTKVDIPAKFKFNWYPFTTKTYMNWIGNCTYGSSFANGTRIHLQPNADVLIIPVDPEFKLTAQDMLSVLTGNVMFANEKVINVASLQEFRNQLNPPDTFDETKVLHGYRLLSTLDIVQMLKKCQTSAEESNPFHGGAMPCYEIGWIFKHFQPALKRMFDELKAKEKDIRQMETKVLLCDNSYIALFFNNYWKKVFQELLVLEKIALGQKITFERI